MTVSLFIQNTLVMGTWAMLFIFMSLLAVAKAERIPLWQPVHAVSHILFGDKVLQEARFHAKYWISGFVLNAGAMYGWAAVAELGYLRFSFKTGDLITAILMAIALTIIAFITDFHIVSKRFTPGFEKVISRSAVYTVYVCLAIGFVFGGMYRIN